MAVPDVSVIVTSFERPRHLLRALRSIALQQRHQTSWEVIVADDGSRDETVEVVERFSRFARFSVTCTTQRHEGFRPARSRNNAVAASAAPYLVFLDGDCVLPPDHLHWHLRLRRAGWVLTGDSYRLARGESGDVTDAEIAGGALVERLSADERRRIQRKAIRGLAYSALGVPMRPRLTANNFSMWRADFERVNGFDETFVGWGLEDKDLQRRLTLAGLRFHTVLHRAVPFHFWHESHPTMRRGGIGTPNYDYYQRTPRQPRCTRGLVQQGPRGMTVYRFQPLHVEHGAREALGKAA